MHHINDDQTPQEDGNFTSATKERPFSARGCWTERLGEDPALSKGENERIFKEAAKISIAGQAVVAAASGAQLVGAGIGPDYSPYVTVRDEGMFEGLTDQMIGVQGLGGGESVALDVSLYLKESASVAMSLVAHGRVFAASDAAMQIASTIGWPFEGFESPIFTEDEVLWPGVYVDYMSKTLGGVDCDWGDLSDTIELEASEILQRNWALVVACYNALTIDLRGFQRFPLSTKLALLWKWMLHPCEITPEGSAALWREVTHNSDEHMLGRLFPNDELA